MAKKTKTKLSIKDFLKAKNLTSRYSETLAACMRLKKTLKVTAQPGDVVLLVRKKGFENVEGVVGLVTSANAENYSFEYLSDNGPKTLTLTYNFLNKEGLTTVGFFTF